MSSGDDRQQVVRSLALAGMVSQIGCVTIVVVIGALAVGLGLDKVLDTRPLFTILLLLGSIPISLYVSVRMALSTAAQLSAPPPQESAERTSAPEETLLEDVPSEKE